MLKTILLPVDGSESSLRAVSFGADLAVELQASILLLHVLDRLPSRQQLLDYLVLLERSPAANEAQIEDIRHALSQSGEDQGKKILADAEILLKDKGVKDVSTAIQDGDPATVILRLAETGKYDMIIMGRRGLGGLKGLFMGSVTHKISNMADCPVVTVN
ncbi:MAG: universal stress protein [Rhodospirillales bacterium]|nr:universal stress protein [Rhodospirillales bacterium]